MHCSHLWPSDLDAIESAHTSARERASPTHSLILELAVGPFGHTRDGVTHERVRAPSCGLHSKLVYAGEEHVYLLVGAPLVRSP